MNTLDELKKAEKSGAKLIALPVQQVRRLIHLTVMAKHDQENVLCMAAEILFEDLAADWNEPEK